MLQRIQSCAEANTILCFIYLVIAYHTGVPAKCVTQLFLTTWDNSVIQVVYLS